jgi:glycosyltransferase involved in cell wall biosynthesis
VAYWAANERFTVLLNRDELAVELQQKYGLKRPFILGSGRLDPHKNILRLVEAYAQLLDKFQIEENLVVVGGRHIPEYTAKVDQLIAERGLQDRVTIIRIPQDEDMPKLYNIARCLVFPSLYEAFGMPLIEAMKCGIPTVTARSSAFPEVGGDATEYVDPYSSIDIARGIHRVLTDSTYADQLVQRGHEWSKQFSWDRHVQSTIEVFRTLLKE